MLFRGWIRPALLSLVSPLRCDDQARCLFVSLQIVVSDLPQHLEEEVELNGTCSVLFVTALTAKKIQANYSPPLSHKGTLFFPLPPGSDNESLV